MDMSNYPHVTIAEDGRLCSTGQHRLRFLRVLYDALLHLGYHGYVPVYRARMSAAHSIEQCEVSVTIPINPEDLWMATVIGIEQGDTIDQMAQVALASPYGSRLADTAATPISLFPFCYRETLCGSSALRSYPTPRVRTTMQAWLHWLGMHNTRSTYSTTQLRLSFSSVSAWLLMRSATF
jgi:hypothetical protein